MTAVNAYIKSRTGLTNEEIETLDDLSVAYLVLVADMFYNRQFAVSKDKTNPIVDSILFMHRKNFL